MFELFVWVVALLCCLGDVAIRLVHGVASFLQFCRFHIYQPCVEYWLELALGVSEEFAKAIIRESFHHLIRFINGLFAWGVSLHDKASKLWAYVHTSPALSRIRWETPQSSAPSGIADHETEQDITQTSSSGDEEEGVRSETWLQRLKCRIAQSMGWRRHSRPLGSVLSARPVLQRQFGRERDPGTLNENVSVWDGTGFHFWSGGVRRGWVEDVQLTLEMAITEVFNFIRKVARILFFLKDHSSVVSNPPPELLPDSIQRRRSIERGRVAHGRLSRTSSMPAFSSHHPLDPGPITAEHFITEAGYPQESHDVMTDDGYILALHRLPRSNAKRTVFFQHGVLDTALGWVCSGVTDSLAFSAWDQGCDVWLGNTRSNPPRRHINPGIAHDQYWRYTLNELGMKDIGAQLEYIHKIKCNELQDLDQNCGDLRLHMSKSEGFVDMDSIDPPLEDSLTTLPYSLYVVGHSLGAAALLVYLVSALYYKKRHYVQRIILMSPAGFHPVYPLLLAPLRWILPPMAWFMENVLRQKGAALIIPGALTRLFVFKILQDAVQYPAIRESLQRGIRWLMNGDVSPWECFMQLPHYDVASMPGIAVHTGMHFVQLVKSVRFRLYDYGTPKENAIHYGSPTPLDLAAEYWRIDIPVDIIAGRNDGVIPPECVRMHVTHMQDKGVAVSYREFEYGHLEFTATAGHDLQAYVLERLSK